MLTHTYAPYCKVSHPYFCSSTFHIVFLSGGHFCLSRLNSTVSSSQGEGKGAALCFDGKSKRSENVHLLSTYYVPLWKFT